MAERLIDSGKFSWGNSPYYMPWLNSSNPANLIGNVVSWGMEIIPGDGRQLLTIELDTGQKFSIIFPKVKKINLWESDDRRVGEFEN